MYPFEKLFTHGSVVQFLLVVFITFLRFVLVEPITSAEGKYTNTNNYDGKTQLTVMNTLFTMMT